ncbi:MAG TPA: A24 family peptidase [Plasticicumulans sp.]|uniref:prepilin peptidase n=1 Tax=Plasticicumulans sp. TaxID=2307179 RepID=UPI002D0B761E|nr:A24 family peptidase [Plasticicumulans sp.]HMV37545.1 A24 family peptidase [Plasticicumulans sp.]HMW28210.1 A24 family peptidase [Plasticicumulans sp.]HND99007.1 A24 family peptidase [Plasticicumulans sp.]HNG50152.1 A24 family peptidase [Plasticicumulans sp.]HNJ06669.1 A24 family peptidase [Plasticicumulans sp.]
MSELSLLLSTQPVLLYTLVALLGLIVGSFLNVVIHRLPLMLERAWAAECAELRGEPPAAQERFDLLWPPSHCPACERPVRPLENLPVLGWLWLRGRCAGCGAPIPLRYPLIEAGCGLLSLVVVWRFGWSLQTPAALALTWLLLALAVIDLRTFLLPDALTLPGLWAGLALALVPVLVPLRDAVIGAMAGFLVLWSVYHVFRLLTGREGMGRGDFKLLALLGAWLGWMQLPFVLLASAGVGAVIGILLRVAGQLDAGRPLPFGPFLAAAGWIALLWGQELTTAYLRSVGL